jgi:hypothetical protein
MQVKPSPENLQKFYEANEWQEKKQKELVENRSRRNLNLANFTKFVREW